MLYSEMTPQQLETECAMLRDQGQEAFDTQDWSRYETLMKKWYLAKSYLMQGNHNIVLGKVYSLSEEPDVQFAVDDIRGVMAWGTRSGNFIRSAVPLAMLEEMK